MTLAAILLLTACTESGPAPVTADANADAPRAAANQGLSPGSPEPLALALDTLFIDADPLLSSGATIARGVLRVGDEVEYLSETGKRVEGRVIEITLDGPNGESSKVSQAKAGDEVFVVFELPATGLAAHGAGLAAPGSVADYAALKAITDAARKPPEAKPDYAPRWGRASYQYNSRAARVRDPHLALTRGLASPSNLLEFAWTEEWGDTRSLSKPRDRDATREITRIDPDQALTFSLDLSFEDADGRFTQVSFMIDDLRLSELNELPVERRYKGAPRLLGPGMNAIADERDGPAYDASEAWLAIDSADPSHGRFKGRFAAVLQRRPEDLIQGHYDAGQIVRIESGEFEVDLSKVE